ncbi:hypothetical protein BV22DRAFT_483 [Leucogyrophana mollusca]|uniref:Uncharacterized protein n=1 Tax=Leucogyrophana mollusca TaxID=85980 RepID=A0ACB8C1D4_9AGAM|nr:hypothetical protein BV22DRAFT_483 [Leucogyrophana mollusca]
MELENVMALLEAESGIPISEQSISYEGRDLSNPKATVAECGVQDKAMLLLRRKVAMAPGGRQIEQDSEMMRLQILGDPALMRQLQQVRASTSPIDSSPSDQPCIIRHNQKSLLPLKTTLPGLPNYYDKQGSGSTKRTLRASERFLRSTQILSMSRRSGGSRRRFGNKQLWKTWSMHSSIPQRVSAGLRCSSEFDACEGVRGQWGTADYHES